MGAPQRLPLGHSKHPRGQARGLVRMGAEASAKDRLNGWRCDRVPEADLNQLAVSMRLTLIGSCPSMDAEDCSLLIEDEPPTLRMPPAKSAAAASFTEARKQPGGSEAGLTVISLFDQAVVSGTRFLTTLFVGRL